MSARASALVWERSRATELDLLVLLAIADYADRDGRNASPTVSSLAAKTRLLKSEVLRRQHRLEQAGELVVDNTAETSPVRYHLRCCYDPLFDQR